MTRIDKKKIFLILFSFFIALFIWAMVMEQRNPEKEYEIRGIQVQLEENGRGPQSAGLTILKGQNQTVSIRIKGLRSDIGAIDESRIVATVDISNIIVAGNYNLPVEVSINNVGISVVDVRPTTINLTVDKMVSRSIPIEVDVAGGVSSEFVLKDIVCSPAQVVVTGPMSELNMIARAKVDIKMNNISQDYTEKQRVVLLDANGEEVRTQHTTKDVESTDISVSLFPTKRIPIEARVTGQLPDAVVLGEITVDPETVEIMGESSYLKLITLAVTEPIDLSQITKTTQVPVQLVLPGSIKTRQENFTPTVTINVIEREERTFSITNYRIENLAEGNYIPHAPAALEIAFLGTPEEFEDFDVEDVMMVIDMENVPRQSGEIVHCAVKVQVPEGTKVRATGEYFMDIVIG